VRCLRHGHEAERAVILSAADTSRLLHDHVDALASMRVIFEALAFRIERELMMAHIYAAIYAVISC